MPDRRRRIGIGIDTGGTFTDAVAVELGSGSLLAKAKAPTTREDLAVGVRAALLALDTELFPDVELVALSTTLATNAVVEGKGCRVGLIVTVPDPATFQLPPGLPATGVAVVAGAHEPDGSLRTPLDLAAAEAAVARLTPGVDALAVSAYFGVANAEHELAVKSLIANVTDAPVVCGHELSQRIGMVERAVTAALNARLLPLIRDLLDAVRATLDACGIGAPLMVVKGDGSLTAESVARVRPVETLLSGPAASVVGACRLSGLTSAIVADMGGTTTDIALVAGAMPRVNADGALVGGWRTRVQALDVRTVGLGGDSRIRLTAEGDVTVGPDRVTPLCVAAERSPDILGTLGVLAARDMDAAAPDEPVFLTAARRPRSTATPSAAALIDALDGRALHTAEALRLGGPFLDLADLVRTGDLAEIAFTPTDALAAAGELSFGDARAARLGLGVLAASARCEPGRLLARVRRAVVDRLALEVAARGLAEDLPAAEPSPGDLATLAHLLGGGDSRVLRARLSLGVPLVAVGAPAAAWFPALRSKLAADLVVPTHAEVANAFGALAGRVLERAEAHVKAEPDESFVVVTPGAREVFDDYVTARARAEELASRAAAAKAEASGAEDAVVTLTHVEVVARQARAQDDVVVELTVVATATGRPYLEDALPSAFAEETA